MMMMMIRMMIIPITRIGLGVNDVDDVTVLLSLNTTDNMDTYNSTVNIIIDIIY